jgi:hypothetical protein
MLIKKLNAVYLLDADRVILKIYTEKQSKENEQYQFILTRRITKKLIEILHIEIKNNKKIIEPTNLKSKNKSDRIPQKILDIFPPELVTDCYIRHLDEGLKKTLALMFKKKIFRVVCSEKIVEILFNLLLEIQKKADWGISLTKKIASKKADTSLQAKKKRVLH